MIEAPPSSAWADSLRVRGAQLEEDSWFMPLAVGRPTPRGTLETAHAGLVPDDPELVAGQQWGLWAGSAYSSGNIDVRAAGAWAVTTGRADVPLAALDTGVDPAHPDLQSAGPEGEPRLLALSAIAGNESDIADSLGHGTMVLGVMGAITNNHLGIAGMAGGNGLASSTPFLYSIKVTSGRGQAARGSDLARGIVMAVGLGARAINISFAGAGTSDALRSALYWATSQGCVVTCGAGNSADDRPQYPAAYADLGLCVAVTAADRDGSQPGFVTRGSWIDGAAPGVDILSTWPGYANAYGSDLRDYASSSGTSFAAPFVAGMAELACVTDSTLAGGDFSELFRRTARDMSAEGGVRFADAEALLSALRPPYRLQHGEAAAEQWWEAGEETLRVRRSGFWREAGAADGDYVARRYEVRAAASADEPLDGAATWVRPVGSGGWRSARTHDGEECWGEVVSELSPSRAELRTFVYRVDVPPAGCDTCAPIGWFPRPPWEVRLPWTRWGAAAGIAAAQFPSRALRIELVGPTPSIGAIRLKVTGFTAGEPMPSGVYLYDVRGARVRGVPIDGEGFAVWDGRDEAGRIAAPGLYFAGLSRGGTSTVRFLWLRAH